MGTLTPPIVWSHNEKIDICAPSYHLMRLNPSNTFVTKCSGTSMSAPIVAGTAALMKSVNPCLTPHDIDEILSNPANADPINDANQYPGLLGAGRLNAFKAVQAAQNYIPSHVALIDKNLINRNVCKGQSTQLFALSNLCANLQWSNPQTLNNSTIANPIATPQQTTVYTLYASYPNGCIRQDTIVIYVYPLPDKPILSGINNTCDGLTLNYTITNYNTQQTYVWNVTGGTVNKPKRS
ncbi:MAG: hypothetical protein KatS3mg027_1890 [Bacteroidia bacterium]|nr:MAG: hypothetical protein KatS3mg027_1890 [Bacteroidia bacterium]